MVTLKEAEEGVGALRAESVEGEVGIVVGIRDGKIGVDVPSGRTYFSPWQLRPYEQPPLRWLRPEEVNTEADLERLHPHDYARLVSARATQLDLIRLELK